MYHISCLVRCDAAAAMTALLDLSMSIGSEEATEEDPELDPDEVKLLGVDAAVEEGEAESRCASGNVADIHG